MTSSNLSGRFTGWRRRKPAGVRLWGGDLSFVSEKSNWSGVIETGETLSPSTT